MAFDEVKYLGRSLKYPLHIVAGFPVYAEGRDAIEDSIKTILSTPVGSRFFLRSYGSRLQELLFEPNDDVLFSLLESFVFEAIEMWERRVQCVRVDCERDADWVNCSIQYRILKSNEIQSFIYPYYKKLES